MSSVISSPPPVHTKRRLIDVFTLYNAICVTAVVVILTIVIVIRILQRRNERRLEQQGESDARKIKYESILSLLEIKVRTLIME